MAGGHPVYGARPDDEICPEAVLVADGAFKQVGHGGEADMRMRAHVESVAGCVVNRSEMVEENERPHHLVGVEGQHAPDTETAAKIAGARLYFPDNLVSHGTEPFPVLNPSSHMAI